MNRPPPKPAPGEPEPTGQTGLHYFWKIFPLAHFVISLLFVVGAVGLLLMAAYQMCRGLLMAFSEPLQRSANEVLEGIAVLTVALASLELGQTIIEEEVQRDSQMSAPTRVRRFLSRFMIVLVVALAIESLVRVFGAGHEHLEQLPYVSTVGFMAAALLVAWGVFIRLNRSAEELEPEAMEDVKREDAEVKEDAGKESEPAGP